MLSAAAFVAVLVLSGMAGLAAAQPPVMLAQYGSGGALDRDSCIQSCREWVGTYAWGFRGDRGGYSSYLYAKCVQDCDTQFWNEFDRKMDRLKQQ
jgi:hypothetical protein